MKVRQLLRVEIKVPVPRWDSSCLSTKTPFIAQRPTHGFQTTHKWPHMQEPFPVGPFSLTSPGPSVPPWPSPPASLEVASGG